MGTRQFKLVVLDDYEGELAHAPAIERLRQLADVTIFDQPLAASNYDRLKEFEVVLALRERTKLDQRFFDACQNLELVLQTGGHAYHIDQNAATNSGVVVALGRRTTKPTIVVPELALGFMLGLVRKIYPLTIEMAQGKWSPAMGGSLFGSTLGILGYGRHGRPVAKLARAFGMKVIAWNRVGSYPKDESSVERVALDHLLAESDIVSIHLRLSDESRGLLNRARIAQMKPGAILINTSRGDIVDESALVEALRKKVLAGAGLDVFSVEPLPVSSPLRTLPNVLLTPHIGWQVKDVLYEFAEIAAEQLEAWLGQRLVISEVLNPGAMAVNRKRSGGLKPALS